MSICPSTAGRPDKVHMRAHWNTWFTFLYRSTSEIDLIAIATKWRDAREAAQSSARLEEDGAVNQSVSVSELPEDKRDRRLQRTLHASTVRVDLRLARDQAIESEYGQSKCYREKVSARPL